MVVRLVLATAVTVVAFGVADWRAGLGTAAAALIAHALYERHRPSPATSWRRGARAERRTGRWLARLDNGYQVLHDRALPDSPATNVDHLVIGLTGIYAVVSRHWRPGTRLWADHRRVWAGNRPVATLPAAAQRIAATVGDLLGTALNYEVTVVPVVAVHGARLPREGLEHCGVVFQHVFRLKRYIEEQSVVFTSAQVATIVAVAERELPPMLDAVPQGIRK